MLPDLFTLAAGIAILLGGGELVVRGAASLARGLGISPLVIGLTVIAFGTSAPELAVNVGAALSNSGGLSFGNVFGSNMANIGLIVGLVAVISPIPIQHILIRRELPMMLLATAAACVLAFDLNGWAMQSEYGRTEGAILLLFFIVFLYYTMGDLARQRNGAHNGDESHIVSLPSEKDAPTPHIQRDIAMSVIGLAGLVLGANLTVDGAMGVARAFEVPEVIIGLTCISIGTSLPELIASLTAIRHGYTDMALGGVVGSNIFNTLLVAGITAMVHPMTIPPGGLADLSATVLLSLTLTLTASTHSHRIIRYEGATLMLAYFLYIGYRTAFIPG